MKDQKIKKIHLETALKKVETFGETLKRFKESLAINIKDNEFILDASIQRFEFSFEMGWKALKKSLYFFGIDATLPRIVIQESYTHGLIKNLKIWEEMLDSRNITSHEYNKLKASEIHKKLLKYCEVLSDTQKNLKEKLTEYKKIYKLK